MASIVNNSDRVLHPCYVIEGPNGKPRAEYLQIDGMATPGVPPSVVDRVGPDGKKMQDLVEHQIPDEIAAKIAAHKPNASLFKHGLELRGTGVKKK